MQMGMRSGLLSGLNARFVPQTAEEFAAALPAVTAPDGLWIFDEATGDFADRIGSNDFSVSAGTVTRGVATPFGPGITLADADAQLTVTSTTFMDAGTATDISSLIVCRPPPAPASSTSLFHKRAAADPNRGWHVWLTAAGNAVFEAIGDHGSDPSDLVGAGNGHNGLWTPIITSIEWDQMRVLTRLGAVQTTVDVGDTSNSQPLTLGDSTVTEAALAQIAYVAVWDGYALTATERQILRDFFA
jgi:hypothetical protein